MVIMSVFFHYEHIWEQNNYITAIKDTFALFDSDHDGKVSKAEIGAMMRTMGYLSCSRQLDDIIARLDSDGKMNSKYNKLLIKPCLYERLIELLNVRLAPPSAIFRHIVQVVPAPLVAPVVLL